MTATHTTPLITGSGLLNVTTGPTFDSWINDYASLSSANRALLADPDGDGLNNLLEYALGGDSILASPAVAPKSNSSSGTLALTFTRTPTTTHITLTVQAADTLNGTWTNLASSVGGAAMAALLDGVLVIETGSGTTRSVEVRDLYLVGTPGHPQRFMRLQVQTK